LKENGIIDVMVYKDDAAKINRIVERLSLVTVAGLKGMDGKDAKEGRKEADRGESAITGREGPEAAGRRTPEANEQESPDKTAIQADPENPTIAGRGSPEATERKNPTPPEQESRYRLGRTSGSSGISGREDTDSLHKRSSVRDEMEEIRKRRADSPNTEKEKKRKPRAKNATELAADRRAETERQRGPYYEPSGKLFGRHKEGRTRK